MSDLYEHLYYSTLDFKTMCQLQRVVSAYRPHGTAAYQDLPHQERKAERNLAKTAGEWRYPTTNELDKAMDTIRHQHQTTRSWHCLQQEEN